MIFAHIDAPGAYPFLLRNEAVAAALEWIRAMPADQAPGIYPIRGEDIFVNVHGYETLPREQCRFESHREYVDIQYCIDGGEFIDVERSSLLTPDGPFDAERDLQFYEHREAATTLHMTPGDFAIFFPEDAHRPKVADGHSPSVRKLVVKIRGKLLIEG